MGSLIKAGKIRSWGMCNDNAYGLAASVYTSRALGVPPPCVLQNDYSLLDRRIEENGEPATRSAPPCHTTESRLWPHSRTPATLTRRVRGLEPCDGEHRLHGVRRARGGCAPG